MLINNCTADRPHSWGATTCTLDAAWCERCELWVASQETLAAVLTHAMGERIPCPFVDEATKEPGC